MAGFEDVTLSWAGRDYVVPVDRVMRLLRLIEDCLIGEGAQDALTVLMDGRRRAPLADAYETALRFAGADLPPGEVYMTVMNALAESRSDHVEQMFHTTMNLLALLAPPMHSRIMAGRSEADGEAGKK